MWEPAMLLDNLDRLHTTQMGAGRIKCNLGLDDTVDVVKYCRDKITTKYRSIIKRGKNWYIYVEDFVLTINANTYNIITAHKL